MNELKTHGMNDALIVVVDGLMGFPEAVETVFPDTAVQIRLVHVMRYSPCGRPKNSSRVGGQLARPGPPQSVCRATGSWAALVQLAGVAANAEPVQPNVKPIFHLAL